MTESEAIARITDHFEHHHYDKRPHPYLDRAVSMAIKALEKQTPMKPARPKRTGMGYDYEDYSCATCEYFIGAEPEIKSMLAHGKTPTNYCPRCGQKINWEETENDG